MSSSSGVLPSSGGGDPMEGTMQGSFAGLGGAGGSDGKLHVCLWSWSGLGEPLGLFMLRRRCRMSGSLPLASGGICLQDVA